MIHNDKKRDAEFGKNIYKIYIPSGSSVPASMPTPMEYKKRIQSILGGKKLGLSNVCYFDPYTDALLQYFTSIAEKEACMNDYHFLTSICKIKEDLKMLSWEYEELASLIDDYKEKEGATDVR